jgi:hypothetical protein
VVSVILLNVVALKADMRGVVLLSVIVLNVVAPFAGPNNSSPAKQSLPWTSASAFFSFYKNKSFWELHFQFWLGWFSIINNLIII